jgi:hypothetical protein
MYAKQKNSLETTRTLNVQNSLDIFAFEFNVFKKGLFTEHSIPYPLSSYSDHSIQQGDVLFEVYNSDINIYNTTYSHHQPVVRGSFNGMIIQKPPPGKNDGDMIWSQIRIVGLALTTQHFKEIDNFNSPSLDDPIAVIDGLMHTTNYSEYQVQAGDYMIAQLPRANHVQHYTSFPNTTKVAGNTNRRVMELVPLQYSELKSCLVSDPVELLALIMSRFVGIAQTSAPPNYPYEIFVNPTARNFIET